MEKITLDKEILMVYQVNMQDITENLSESKKRRLKNLKPPWKSRPPGAGRKKGKLSIINEIKKLLNENNREGARELAESLLKNFKKGNPVALNQVMNRVDGVVKDEHEVKAALKIELVAYSPSPPAPGK